MVISPREYMDQKVLFLPDECYREWQCETKVAEGKVCYRPMRYGPIVSQLDQETRAKMLTTDLYCPKLYVDLVNRCLYGRQAERGGCPKDLGDPYKLKS